MMKRWHAAWGAEVVAMNTSTIEMQIIRLPVTREAAYRLAQEQYCYCPDLVDQYAWSLHPLARYLRQHTVWWFWWD
jgi:hypothetical protein